MTIWGRSQSLSLDIFRLGCHGLTLALLISFLGDYVPIGDSLAVFRIEMALLLLAAGGVALVLKRQFVAMTSVVMGLVSGLSILPFLGGDTPVAQPGFILHQHNVLYANENLDRFAEQMIASDADILTLQEIGSLNIRLETLLKPAFPHARICRYKNRGVAVFARNLGDLVASGCASPGFMAWMRIGTPDGPVTFASVHLFWPWPKTQFWQTHQVVSEIEKLARPVVIGGDFNIVPWAASIRRIAKAAGGRIAGGLTPTYTLGKGWPAFRIDNIIRPDGGSAPVERTPRFGSDHYGLTGRISL